LTRKSNSWERLFKIPTVLSDCTAPIEKNRDKKAIKEMFVWQNVVGAPSCNKLARLLLENILAQS